jgi:hypothetical protein
LTGAIKWNREPLGAKWFHHHEAMLERLAESGVAWAARAVKSDSPVLFVAAGGFQTGFQADASAGRSQAYLWDLDDLYSPSPRDSGRPRRSTRPVRR